MVWRLALKSRLTSLIIHRFRNVVPETELRFDGGMNVLLGRNGSGKTTMLRLLEALLSGDFRVLLESKASITADFEGSWQELPAGPLGPRRSGRVRLVYSAIDSEERVRLEIFRDDDGRRAALRYEDRVLLGEEDGSEVWRQAVDPPEGNLSKLILWRSDLPEWTKRWSGAVNLFGWSERFAEDLYQYDELRLVEVVFAGQPTSGSLSTNRRGGPLLRYVADSFMTQQPMPRHVTLASTSPIHEAAQRMGFRTAEVTLRANDTGADPVVYGGLSLDFQRQDQSWVRDDKLSWGQKRFLSWWVHLDDATFVIADELTNGLHHEWIEQALGRIGSRQAFLATQNPLLLDHLEFGDPASVERRIVRCAPISRDGREMLEWRNPTPIEANRFYENYEVGIQHVSELLRLEDLW